MTDQPLTPHTYRLPVYRVELIKERTLRADLKVIEKPADAAALFRLLHEHIDRECLVVFCLDTKNAVRAINTLSIGDLSSSIVNPREVFKPAILANAASIVVAHNHPSGDPSPSADDTQVSRRLVEAGKLLTIEVLDHVIVGENTYLSLAERGLM